MQYFQYFPKIGYTTTEKVNGEVQKIQRVVPNMTIKLQLDVLNNSISSFETYRIKDGDRIDTVAAQMYGNSRYAWVIMLANNHLRDVYDWPMTDAEHYVYLNAKYESSPGANDGFVVSQNSVWQYTQILDDGREVAVDETAYNLLEPTKRRIITVFDYEYDENDEKRLINLVSMESLQEVIKQFNKVIAQ